MTQEWLEAFDDLLAGEQIAVFTPPAARPLIQIRAVSRQVMVGLPSR